ncbi:MAG TPA: hypothetical protein VJN93_11345 [Candidatus Acidoferrum sp.]|nr:hypothetical protein [Candidatus Acidoferrum sp.]
MNIRKIAIAVLFAGFLCGGLVLRAQDKTKSQNDSQEITPLRVQVVFMEYDGDKKISSLPYTLLVNADDKGPQAALRMGLRVPIEVGTGGMKQFQYQDVGTNLDGRANKTEDGRFNLRLNVEKSSLYTPGPTEKPVTVGGNEVHPGQPVMEAFRSQVNLILRDGQTIQATVATDPVNGHVLKVEVTLNVIK